MAYAVEQRTRELHRLALGAERGALRNMVISQAMRMALAGMAIGMAAAVGPARLNFLVGGLSGIR
jgi:putative ABC transport system permease protein